MRYDSTYSALVALNKKMGGEQSSPISEYDAVTNLMSTMSGGEVDVNDPVAAVEQVVVKAENNELPIQGCKLKTLNITNNGVYNADKTFNGWNKVVVNVSNPLDIPRVELVSSTYVDNHTNFSFTIRMSEGYPWNMKDYDGCPWIDAGDENKWINNGNGTYTYNVNIEETGECKEGTSYFNIKTIYIDRTYNDVSIRFEYPINTRINFN